MKVTCLLALLALAVVQAQSRISRWGAEAHVRSKREYEMHSWLTEEQKEALKELKGKSVEFRDKVLEFYNQLPQEKRKEWDEFYKKDCVAWIKEVATEEEIKELKELKEKKDKETLLAKVRAYKDRLPEKKRKGVELYEDTCLELYKDELSRKRRDIDKNFEEFTKWMTEEQKKEINDLKDAGKTFEELREKTVKYFEALPADKQESLKEEFKGKCKAFFKKISTPEEMEKMKALHEAGNDDEIHTLLKDVIARQSGDDQKLSKKMQMLCTDVFAVKAKRRRDIDEKINRRLSWMTSDQKEECYKWMEDVATTEEIAALHKMHETDHDGCKKKVREFMGRLSADRKAEVEKNLPFCEKVWYGDHDHHGHHGHHGRRHLAERRRRHLHAIDKFLDWLTPEQKNTLEDIEKSGKHFDEVVAKVKEFYGALPEEKKAELKTNFKSQCSARVKEVATPEEMESIKQMHESKNHADLKKKLSELENRLTEEQKHTVEHVREVCFGVWELENTRRRRDHHEHHIDEDMEKYLTWLTAEQKEKVKETFEKDREAAYKMIMEMFESSSGEVKSKATEELKSACKHYGRDILGDKNADLIKEMRETGATNEAIMKKIEEMIAEMTDDDRKMKAGHLTAGCKKIYGAGRTRRDHHHHTLEEAFEKYLTWLNDEQKEELKSLKESGDKEGIYKKILEYFDGTSGETKVKAAEELQAACKHYIKDFLGDEKAAEFRQMKESGVSVSEIAKKVEEAIEAITDDALKSKAQKASIACKRVFDVPKRLRRDHHEHSFEEAMEKYLSWLTDDQKIEMKSLHDAGDKTTMYEKIMEMFEAATGETKEKAAKELKGACKHYVKDLIGDENAEKIREMKESGASNDEIATKVEEMIEEIADDEKKSRALKASTYCRKIYSASSRMRRDHHDHEHNIEEAMEKYLSWLTEDQKADVKKVFEAEGRPAVYKKVLEWYESAEGDVKEKATTELKAACKHYVKDHIGEEQAEKLKEMKDSGATKEEIAAKVDEFIASITDEKKKEQATRASVACKKIYGVKASRMRRDYHDHKHSLEEAMEKWLTWLNEDQKAELKKISDAEGREAVYNKIMEYFDESSGEKKEKAAFELKAACRHYITDAIGQENAEKIKEMKEKDFPHKEIADKVREFIEAISDTKKKEEALRAAKGCEKVYGVVQRMKRDHHDHEHSLKEAMENYLTWLSEDQKGEVKKLFEDEGRSAAYKKVMEYFESASGDVKEKAATELKAACKHYVKDYIGEENTNKIKEMKESGASNEAIATKIEEFIAAITDEEKKARALKMSAGCKKIYGVARRMRRDHHHNLEEAMQKYLTWMNDEQKTEFKKTLEGGDRLAAYKKVFEYFETTTGESRTKAAAELKSACKHYVKDLIGEEKAARIRHLKESGATNEAIAQELDAIISLIPNEKKRMEAQHAAGDCKRIYGLVHRRRRDHHEPKLEEALGKYLTWLNDDQKNELKQLKEKGDREAIYKKIMEYFESATGDVKEKATEELKSGCKHYIIAFLGKEKADELKAMKDSGASQEEMAKKVDEAIEAIADEEKKAKAKKAAVSCRKIYGVTKARRHLVKYSALKPLPSGLCAPGSKRFKAGNKKLEDEPRSGRPTAISFDELKNLAEQHPYEGVRYFAARLGCSLSTVSNGLRSVGMVKKLVQWLPHALSDGNRQRRLNICTQLLSRSRKFDWLDTIVTGDEKWFLYVNHTLKSAWCASDEVPDPFVKGGIHEKKVMLSVWWGVHRIYHFELLPYNMTVTAEVYCAQLQRVADKIRKEHPKLDNIRLLHDSARSHIAKKTSQKIQELGWKVLLHLPYNPDLAPGDYHLFRSLQHHLEEKRYDDRDLENDLRASLQVAGALRQRNP
ncbi:hypothetical protein RB195_015613 [Necator americanus]|uniref:Polyprotein allergen nematode domain-containing protein n=1 Tax=Necator americanus TaxID=51031 RepID=A0ABR1E5D0_NECAM